MHPAHEEVPVNTILTPEATPAPWSMPLAFEVVKSAPPTTTAVNESATRAVALFLSDERAGTEWAAAVQAWADVSKMRKVVRRGTPAHFQRAEHLPGVTSTYRGVRVRAFLPSPTDALDSDLRRMQVSGSEFELGVPSEDAFLTVEVNPSLTMSTGKSSAQCGHAAQLALLAMTDQDKDRWAASGFSVRVLRPDAAGFAAAAARVRVFDAGFTEIPAGSNTVVASW